MINFGGNRSLAQLQIDIRAFENAGRELLGFLPLMDGTTDNGASFKDLAVGCPAQINLTQVAVPVTGTLVCFATIYVSGNLVPISAYR